MLLNSDCNCIYSPEKRKLQTCCCKTQYDNLKKLSPPGQNDDTLVEMTISLIPKKIISSVFSNDIPNCWQAIRQTQPRRAAGCSYPGKCPSRTAKKDQADGLLTTSFLIRTAFQHWLKSSGAATPESAERLWDRCWTMQPMPFCTGQATK